MCAIEAGKRGRRVAVLERAGGIGKKILISGGGRCNFTNLHYQAENFISANPHFAKSALAAYTPADFIALVEKHGIAYHEKTLGQLFCDGSSRQMVDMLTTECDAVGVKIFLDTNVEEVLHAADFVLRTSAADFHASSLVVATGGLSIPKIGATDFGYTIAQQFGIDIVEPYPALVPLTWSRADYKRYVDLSGISTEVIASIGKRNFREKMLFTHRGLSGPAILQISSYWKPNAALHIDLAPDKKITADFADPATPRNAATLLALLRQHLPARLADRWLELHPPADFTNHSLAEWERLIHHWQITPAGTEGYDKAEVTAGGVNT